MSEHDKDQFEEIDPPAWALAAASPLEEMEEYLPPTDPNISVVAGSQPTKPERPRGVAVEAETETVVDQIARFIERFVFLKTKSLYRLLALWTIETHMYAEFEYTGYIFAYFSGAPKWEVSLAGDTGAASCASKRNSHLPK